MEFKSDFKPLELASLHTVVEDLHHDGWRYVQILAVNKDNGVDLVYSFMKDGTLDNYVISDVARDAHVPSISDLYLEAFVCENEIHDLFGVAYQNIAIDFLGNFYHLSTEKPMTIISPEQLAEREKLKKIAAAKAAKAEKEAHAAKADSAASSSEEAASAVSDEEVAEKLKHMDPEKAAKVKAALEAKRKKETAQKESSETSASQEGEGR